MDIPPFIQDLRMRGFIHQTTDEEAIVSYFTHQTPATAYIGFDCTAPSLHVGSLIQLMILRKLQTAGHKPVILLGGGTSRVGDPSGKDSTRQLMDENVIARNSKGILATIEKFVTIGNGPTDALVVNNDDWLKELNYIDFLRTIGGHFSVNRMLTQDSVKTRLEREQNLSFLEFNYMVLQAYDFVELSKRHGCRLQIGGSDQWGNIIMGIELARRMQAGATIEPSSAPATTLDQASKVLEVQPMIHSSGHELASYSTEHFLSKLNAPQSNGLLGITTPLLTTSDGKKMGKTADGAIWLDADMLPPYEYWQFWRNVEDADVIRFLKLFTELPLEEITKLEKLKGAAINEAKIVLANEATRLCHGTRAAKKAAETAKKVFEEGNIGDDLPEYPLTAEEIGKGIPAYDLLRLAGLTKSGGEARRLIRGGGAKLNDRKILDENELITQATFKDNQLKLSAGRKKHMIVKLNT